MDNSSRFPAFLAYLLPVVGWVYALVAHRKNSFVVFHAKQAIGLVLFLVLVFASWAVAGYLIAMIPYLAIISATLFTLVIAAFIFGIIAWVMGMLNALRGQIAFLPIFGHKANTLPF